MPSTRGRRCSSSTVDGEVRWIDAPRAAGADGEERRRLGRSATSRRLRGATSGSRSRRSIRSRRRTSTPRRRVVTPVGIASSASRACTSRPFPRSSRGPAAPISSRSTAAAVPVRITGTSDRRREPEAADDLDVRSRRPDRAAGAARSAPAITCCDTKPGPLTALQLDRLVLASAPGRRRGNHRRRARSPGSRQPVAPPKLTRHTQRPHEAPGARDRRDRTVLARAR